MTTAVFHGIELRNAFNKKRLLLCGSLMDESWIQNLFYQMTNFTEPYKITTWNKTMGYPCPFTSNILVVLHSPNTIRCKQIKDCIDYYHPKTSTFYTVRIAPSQGIFSYGSPDHYIDATSMNYKELADQLLFLSTRSK